MSVWQNINNFFITLSNKLGLIKNLGQALDIKNWVFGGRDAAFTIALVALYAKMAGADGVVTNSEIAAFKASVDVPADSEEQVDKLFELAQSDIAGYKSYAKKIKRLFSDNLQTLEHVLEGLFFIAAADGLIHEDELNYLKSVSEIFGFDDVKFEQIAAAFMIDDEGADPYIVLGLLPSDSNEKIKRIYRTLVSENHPDRLIASGLPKEMHLLATGRMAAINSAYDLIVKARNI